MRYLFYAPLALAILLVLAASMVDDPSLRKLLAGWVALLLGLWTALSGVRAVARGRVLLRTKTVLRDEQPIAFWIAVIFFRFALATILLVAGAWSLLRS
jgi:hypothetical protein